MLVNSLHIKLNPSVRGSSQTTIVKLLGVGVLVEVEVLVGVEVLGAFELLQDCANIYDAVSFD